MKIYLIIAVCIFFNTIYSQKNSLVKGYVSFDSIPLENVNVKNISTNDYTTTDGNGFFYLNSKAGDTLFFSYLGMKNVTKLMSDKDILKSNLSIIMEEHSTKLEEVVVNYSKINAVSLGIIQKKNKPLTVNERRLKTAGDFKPIQLLALLGGSLPLDPILNSINGRTKQLKKNIEIEKKEAVLNYLKMNYHGYINKDLKLTNEEDVNQFYYFLVDMKDVVESIHDKNDLKIKFFLCNALIEFKTLNEKTSEILEKKQNQQ